MTLDPHGRLSDASLDARLGALVSRVVGMNEIALRGLAATWEAEDEWQRNYIWRRVDRALRKTGRAEVIDDLREQLRRWINAGPPVMGGVDFSTPWAMPDSETRVSVAGAVLDAAAALAVGHVLDDSETDFLTRPIRTVRRRI